MKRLGVFLLPPGWDDSPTQGYRHKYAGTHLYTWVELRGTESKVSVLQDLDPATARVNLSRVSRSNFCKDHRDKTEVPNPLVVEDLISDKLNNRRKLARLIKQCRNIFSNISEGTASLLQGVTGSNTLKKEGRAFRNIGKKVSILPCNFCLLITSPLRNTVKTNLRRA